MTLSAIDNQIVARFAKEHPEVLGKIITASAERLHADGNFFGESLTVAMFVAFCKSLSEVAGGVVAIPKLVDAAQSLFEWGRRRLAGDVNIEDEKLALNQRVLVLIFEAFLNRKTGVKMDSLIQLLNSDEKGVVAALEQLKACGVIRKARDGSWKYIRAI